MPATESTWRDQKLMHVVFGVSSIAMLATTVWMLAADHTREWKEYQRDFRDVESWTARSRVSSVVNDPQYQSELKKREAALEAARQEMPKESDFKKFKKEVFGDARQRDETPNFRSLDAAYEAVKTADKENRPAAREAFIDDLNDYVRKARFRENNALTAKKFKAADFDVARSQYELGVGNGLPQSELDAIEKRVIAIKKELDEKTQIAQDANTHRKDLERIVSDMTKDETDAKKALDDQRGVVKRLEDTVTERQNSLAKDALALPIIDAFGRPLEVKQIWLPKLTINNNFRDVPRFDRCTTCHLGIDKTAPGSAAEAGYQPQKFVTLNLQMPTEPTTAVESDTPAERLMKIYGLELEDHGLLNENDATVKYVAPQGLAAKSGLLVGDVIFEVGGARVVDKRRGIDFLLEAIGNGKTVPVTVRRGLPHPYISHPRLDLFVGSLSPHKLQDIGCTICHEGQGSSTSFAYTSHSPNDPRQEELWQREHKWFDNHHWIFPMPPARFAESTCLKCHHQVESLEPSERFPEPPAPKLVAGYNQFRQNGCYGCHEVNGYDGPNRRIGPDVRTEPNYSAAAQALIATKELSKPEVALAEEVTYHPDDNNARHALQESIKAAFAGEGEKDTAEQRISPATRKLANVLDDVETPGKFRKVGPSLRRVASKVDHDWLYSWVRKPSDFRPDTKMPQFFGLWDHLDGVGLEEAEKFEPLEIRGIVAYLTAKSQPFEFASQPEEVTEKSSAERGKHLFETRGCLACHKHKDFPKAAMTQGPDLSNAGDKFASKADKNGPDWIYTWLRNPSAYHPRTLMPNLILNPIKDADGNVSDPAADLTQYLLGSTTGWKPTEIPPAELTSAEAEALDQLALSHLKDAFPRRKAEQYLGMQQAEGKPGGIPEADRGQIKGDDIELLGPLTPEKKLLYVGRRSISKYGCSGCHDIPGFEDAKPIGTGLADWGRKGADKLAFEQITTYLTHGHGHAANHAEDSHAKDGHAKDAGHKAAKSEVEQAELADHEPASHQPNFLNMEPTLGFFMQKLFGHQREGFIWQKLREPRSYDYKKTENKGYNERLRMPKFTVLDDTEREQIITFVLGLVAEPPSLQYIFKPNARQEAIIAGRGVLDKFNCAGCHTLQMDTWKLAYAPEDFDEVTEPVDYPFLIQHASEAEIKQSLAIDMRGLRHATIHGMPIMSDETGKPIRYDEDGVPIEADDTESKGMYSFTLYRDAVINGQERPAGVQNLLVPEDLITQKFEAIGGYLPRLIFPAVAEGEKAINPNAKPEETWAYLPPPLLREGEKVQSNWLHSFLLDPYPIRPAVILRMPKFNMSSDDATKLVNYFAAVDGAPYPYNYDPRTSEQHLELADKDHPHRFQDALKIVTDGNYCVKCHLVGDYQPAGSDRAKGPQLGNVYERMRPEYLRNWIANPKRILPYTAMPVNIPYDKPVSQSLYAGDSTEQLDAVVDLLLNYDRYAEAQTSIKPLVKPAAPAGEEAAPDDKPSTTKSKSK